MILLEHKNYYIDVLVCDTLADICERFAKKISCVLAFDVLNVTCCKEFPNLLLIIRKKNIKPPTVSDMCVFYPSLSLLRFHCVFLTIRFLCFHNRLQLKIFSVFIEKSPVVTARSYVFWFRNSVGDNICTVVTSAICWPHR